jgi:hypothetical protein
VCLNLILIVIAISELFEVNMNNNHVLHQVSELLSQAGDLIRANSPRHFNSTESGSGQVSYANASSPTSSSGVLTTAVPGTSNTRGVNIQPAPFSATPRNRISLQTGNSSGVSVLSELRSSFAPYEQRDQARRRAAGRPARTTGHLVVQGRAWTRRVYCLGGPLPCTTPNAMQRTMLSRSGLGEGVIRTGNSEL